MRVLVADDDVVHRTMAVDCLSADGMEVEAVGSAERALEAVRAGKHFDAIVTDYKMTGISGVDLIRELGPPPGAPPIVLVTGMGDERIVAQAFKAGAYDYAAKDLPHLGYLQFLPMMVRDVVRRAELLHENLRLREQVRQLSGASPIVAVSTALQNVLERASRVAVFDSTVLITGESGTGKELLARAIHDQSPRRNGPFVAASCGALPETLLESELFGHEDGAFTGTRGRKIGRFERAQGGTIFLDEISEISPKAQVDLLRVLQELRFERIGSSDTIDLNVRVLAATNKDLAECVGRNTFRSDLYHRLNVIPIHIPPLRDRPDDIAPLAYHFLRRFAQRTGKAVEEISTDALEALTRFRWPGNVRELENAIEHSVVLARHRAIHIRDLPVSVRNHTPHSIAPTDRLMDLERDAISRVLAETGWNLLQASKRLGVSRTTLYSKIRKHRLAQPGGRDADAGGRGRR
jgi:two-component system response regulator HydG